MLQDVDLGYLSQKKTKFSGSALPQTWWEKIVSTRSYDYTFTTPADGTKLDIFEVVPIEMNEGEDTLVIIA